MNRTLVRKTLANSYVVASPAHISGILSLALTDRETGKVVYLSVSDLKAAISDAETWRRNATDL